MFVIKYDKLSMIRLVRAIEKHPAIYDTKKHYSKEAQDSAWDEVAIEVDEKDSLCRDRWHSIKSCYIRHLKFSAINSKRKPYYLAEFLHFLSPFVIEKIETYLASKKLKFESLPTYLREALPKEQDPRTVVDKTSNINNYVVKEEIIDIKEEIVDVEEDEPEDSQQPSSSAAPVHNKRLLKTLVPTSPPKKVKTLKVNDPHKSSCNQDEDIQFFKNLLPEVARMSSHQKLKFRQEALSIVEDILYASEDVDVTD